MDNSEDKIAKLLNELKLIGQLIPQVPSAYPLKSPIFGDGVSAGEIKYFEVSTGNTLPDDFRHFQILCSSITAMDAWNGYSLFTLSHIRSLLDGPNYSIHFGIGVLPIGGDGGGNLFLASGPITKWDHETAAQNQVANNFTDFLSQMLIDWKHFVREDSNWKYLSG